MRIAAAEVVVDNRGIPAGVEAGVEQAGTTEVAGTAAVAVDTSNEAEAGEGAGTRQPTATDEVGEKVRVAKEDAGATTARTSAGGRAEAVVAAAPTGTIVGAVGGEGKGGAAEDAVAALLTVEETTPPEGGKAISAAGKAPVVLARAWATGRLERGPQSRAVPVMRR